MASESLQPAASQRVDCSSKALAAVMSGGMSVGEAIPAAYALLGRSPDITEAADLVQFHTPNEHHRADCSNISCA